MVHELSPHIKSISMWILKGTSLFQFLVSEVEQSKSADCDLTNTQPHRAVLLHFANNDSAARIESGSIICVVTRTLLFQLLTSTDVKPVQSSILEGLRSVS